MSKRSKSPKRKYGPGKLYTLPKQAEYCDRVLLTALSSCDFRGGFPRFQAKKPNSVIPNCRVPTNKNRMELERLWKNNLAGCKLFQREGNELVTIPPANIARF